MKQTTPHNLRRQSIHGFILIILLIAGLIMAFGSCSPKTGCPSHQGFSGYGWIKCRETGLVSVLAPDGAIVCTYYEPTK